MVTIQGYYSQKRIHNKYKDVLLNKKCVRHSMNRIEGKDHKIGTYEIDKFFLSCFDDKMSIQNNGCDEFALGYYKKTATSITLFFFKRFCKASCFNFFPGQNSFVANHISFNFLSGQSGFLSDFWLGILNLKNAKNL